MVNVLDYYTIGQQIRKMRKGKRFVPGGVGGTGTHMSYIKTGNAKLSLPVLVDIAAVLEVRTDDLLNSKADTGTALDEIAAILEGCTAQQSKVIADIVKTAKLSMDKYL